MTIKVILRIINKGIGIALITSINSFLISPALSQSISCSNYWVNPNTGKTECFGSSDGRGFGVVPENSGNTTQYDPFQIAKESLDESCFSIWLEKSRNLNYGSRRYNRLKRSFEDCKVAQDQLREQEKNERNARWEQARQEREQARQEREQEIINTSTSASKDKVKTLKGYCEKIITSKLKAPSTAKFSQSKTIETENKGIYIVSGYVDAQNSYGAMIRNSYYCKFSHRSGQFTLLNNFLID